MASSVSGGRHLGAANGREVVFCHACENEWYRDEHESLVCPSCQSSFTEIVDSSNDPRNMHGGPTPSDSSRSGRSFHQTGGDDSDPEEGDIEEHLYGDPRRMFRRPGDPRSPGPDSAGANANEGDAILRRFADMLMHDLGGLRAARASPGAGALFPTEEHVHPSGARIQQTTFRAGPFGTATRITITSGNGGGGMEASPLNFGTLFGQLFGNPWTDDPARRERGGPDPVFPPFMSGLTDLLTSMYNPAAAVHGDAVFTQEALDRIVTQLMEQSPQTNAAPPASQSAIDRLEKKKVDDEMLGPEGKAECTICIDEINKGDEVLVLPCKHWYHGECVVLWLKEHNTCPICRMPIENREGGDNNNTTTTNNNNNSNSNGTNNQQPQSPQPQDQSSAFASASAQSFPFSSLFNPSPSPFSSVSSSHIHPEPERESERAHLRARDRPAARSARENLDRLAAIRDLAGAGYSSSSASSHSPDPATTTSRSGSGPSNSGGLPGGSSHHGRRNSHSPPGAWGDDDDDDHDDYRERERESGRVQTVGDGSSHLRTDNGGYSSYRDRDEWERERERGRLHVMYDANGDRRREREREREREQQGSGGGSGIGNPLGWLREHFGRGSGSGGGERRR
ncbi:hypothetical protein VTI74DRAFT_821 [Chaetomium olivicolor]